MCSVDSSVVAGGKVINAVPGRSFQHSSAVWLIHRLAPIDYVMRKKSLQFDARPRKLLVVRSMKCNTISELERFLVIQEQALGLTAPEVAITLSKLAELYLGDGNLDRAETLFNKAYDIQNKFVGFHRQGIEHIEEKLQQIRHMRAGTISAAIQSSAKISGPECCGVSRPANNQPVHPEDSTVASDKQVYVTVNHDVGRQPLAGGSSSATTSSCDLSPVQPHSSPGKYSRSSSARAIEAAIQELEVEIEILKHMVGPDHPSVADLLTKTADLYCRLRIYTKMEPLLVDALRIRECACGSEHPSVSTELKNLGALYCVQERWNLAEPLLKRSISIRERAYGKMHPRVADVENHYAHLLRKTNRIAQAEQLEHHINQIRSAYGSPNFPSSPLFGQTGGV